MLWLVPLDEAVGLPKFDGLPRADALRSTTAGDSLPFCCFTWTTLAISLVSR